MVSEERYEETVEAWLEGERDRLMGEGDLEAGDEPRVSTPDPDDAFGAEELPGYADGDWPEFAPRVMKTWVDEQIIQDYGGYVYPTLDAEYPVIDFDNEEKVASLLEARGYACVRDDDLIWKALWGG